MIVLVTDGSCENNPANMANLPSSWIVWKYLMNGHWLGFLHRIFVWVHSSLSEKSQFRIVWTLATTRTETLNITFWHFNFFSYLYFNFISILFLLNKLFFNFSPTFLYKLFAFK